MSDIPRRACIDLFTPAEKAIREAIVAVEASGCDERLTWAVMALSDAQAWVADFVDGVPVEQHYPRPLAGHRNGEHVAAGEAGILARWSAPSEPESGGATEAPCEMCGQPSEKPSDDCIAHPPRPTPTTPEDR